MSSIVDFLERMGSQAHWRYASHDDIQTALEDAGVEASMRTAILARNADEVQALLGRVKMMPQQVGNPGIPIPHEVPKPPQPAPGEPEEEEENDGPTGETKHPKSAYDSPSSSLHSSS